MAYGQQLVSDKNTYNQQQYPSPDASFENAVVSTTSVPPSPPPSSSSSTTSPPRACLRPRRRAGLPPSVVPAFQCIQDSRNGRYEGPTWAKFPGVSRDNLEALVSAAEHGGVYKLRYDYDPSVHLLILRMPEGKTHNFTKAGFAASIWKCLTARLDLADQQVREEQESGWESKVQALQDIKSSLKSTTEAATTLPGGEDKSPDISFYYRDHIYPPLVAEVGYSQKGAELPVLARRYIEKTGGDVHTVITVDIAHNTPRQLAGERRRQRLQGQVQQQGHETRSRSRQRQENEEAAASVPAGTFKFPASVSLFRLGKRVVHDQLFRDDYGNRLDGSLELNVADFVPLDAETSISRTALEALTFTVPFSDLYDELVRGERQQLLEEKTPPPQAAVQAGKKRVHFEFDWDLPDNMAGRYLERDNDEGGGKHGDLTLRKLRSSSKKHRTDSDQMPHTCAESDPEVAVTGTQHVRRRSSSRLRGRRSG